MSRLTRYMTLLKRPEGSTEIGALGVRCDRRSRRGAASGLWAERTGRLTRLVALTVGLPFAFAVWTASQPAAGASLPPGFQEEIVFSRADGNPRRCASRRTAASSWPRRAASSRSSTTCRTRRRRRVRRPPDAGPQLLGSRAARPGAAAELPARTRGSTSSTRTTPPSGAPRRGGGRWEARRTTARPRPGATADGCVVPGRLSRLQASGNTMVGSEQVLIEDWCQQYPSHSIGSLAFGADGALYVSGGDGASFNFVDYGQDGAPVNPCGDPPGGVGGSMAPPDGRGWGAAESGRAHARRPDGPRRLDPARRSRHRRRAPRQPDGVEHAMPTPAGSSAYGLRNPFRITTRPGTNEVWIGDVGWSDWEEINRLVSPDRGAGRELWLALLRGRRPAERLRRREPRALREPLRGRDLCGGGAVLPVPPQRPRAAQRCVPKGWLIGRGHLVRLRERGLIPGRVRGRACSSPTTPADASGRSPPVPTGFPTSPSAARSWLAPPSPSTSRSGLVATCST